MAMFCTKYSTLENESQPQPETDSHVGYAGIALWKMKANRNNRLVTLSDEPV